MTFALLLARIQGAGSEETDRLSFVNAQNTLHAHHNLLSAALEALTRGEVRGEIRAGLDSLLRLIGAVPDNEISGDPDPWLYFYEDFLSEYDHQLRRDAGVYYTPIEVVRAQIRLIDNLLVNRLNKPDGFADTGVTTIDPATGTGTYLLGIIDHCLRQIGAKYGEGSVPQYADRLGKPSRIRVDGWSLCCHRTARYKRLAGIQSSSARRSVYLLDRYAGKP